MGWLGFIVGLVAGAMTKSPIGLILCGALGAYGGTVLSKRQAVYAVPPNTFEDTAPEPPPTRSALALQLRLEQLEQRLARLEQQSVPDAASAAPSSAAFAAPHGDPALPL